MAMGYLNGIQQVYYDHYLILIAFFLFLLAFFVLSFHLVMTKNQNRHDTCKFTWT